MASSPYNNIRTNNEEDTQQLSFRPTTISSTDELRTEMNKIGTNINTVKTNWKSRVSSIQQIGNIISGGILNKFPSEFINLLHTHRDGICHQITELRSGVTKEIFAVLSYLVLTIDSNHTNHLFLKQQIQPFTDYIIPYILKQVPQTILIISHGSNITLRTIIKYIPIYKSLNHILINTNITHQKSICIRVRCMEYLQIIIETQTYHNNYLLEIDNIISKIMDIIILSISDPHPSVRYVSRQCVWSLHAIYPNDNYYQYILNKISSQNAKYVQTEKINYKMLPPPVGSGHKIQLNPNRNKGLINNKNSNINANNNKKAIRPKSALPSRTHRLALLKKRKKEMALKLQKERNNNNNNNNSDIIIFERPKTAHIMNNNNNDIGKPLRIMNNINDKDDNDVVMKDNDENIDCNMNSRMRKISIHGNATRLSSRKNNNNNMKSRNRINNNRKQYNNRNKRYNNNNRMNNNHNHNQYNRNRKPNRHNQSYNNNVQNNINQQEDVKVDNEQQQQQHNGYNTNHSHSHSHSHNNNNNHSHAPKQSNQSSTTQQSSDNN
eukprot:396315_1